MINSEYKNSIEILEMNFVHFIIRVADKKFGKDLEICFKIQNKKLNMSTKDNMINYNFLEFLFQEKKFSKFFFYLTKYWYFFNFLYKLNNNELKRLPFFDSIENKREFQIIAFNEKKFILKFSVKDYLYGNLKTSKSMVMNEVYIDLNEKENIINFHCHQKLLIYWKIFYFYVKNIFRDIKNDVGQILSIKFHSENEMLNFFQLLITFVISYNSILLNFIYIKIMNEKSTNLNFQTDDFVPKPEIKFFEKSNSEIKAVQIKSCQYSLSLELKESEMRFMPQVNHYEFYKKKFDVLISHFFCSKYFIYKDFSVFNAILWELYFKPEFFDKINKITNYLKASSLKKKPYTYFRINFFSFFKFLTNPGDYQDIFHLKIIIYDAKSYIKAKMIFSDTFKLILENKNQIEFKSMEKMLDTIIHNTIKELFKKSD